MSIVPANASPIPAPPFAPPECVPNYDSFITEDETPVGSFYSERQHRLLTDALHVSWAPPGGQPHLAATDVGLFFSDVEPPVVPDVLVAVGVTAPSNIMEKKNHSYFTWRFGKPPDAIVEVVSNAEGGELTTKFDTYARIRVPYYVVWDPAGFLSKQPLQCFKINGAPYKPCEPWFESLELGVTTWTGEYDGISGEWLRWCDRHGTVLATGVEWAAAAKVAETKAAKLAEKLRSLGVDPEA